MVSCKDCEYPYTSPHCFECEAYKGLKGEELEKHNERIKTIKENRKENRENDNLDLRCIKLDAKWDGYEHGGI